MHKLKNLSNLCSDFSRNLPEFLSNQKINYVYRDGKPDLLDFPMEESEINCPMCGGNSGYKVIQENGIAWSCDEEQCIQANGKKENDPRRFSPSNSNLLSLRDFGVPEQLGNVRFQDISQPYEILNPIKEFCKNYHGFLLMSGTSGTGKTFCSCAIMEKYLQQGNECRFVNVADLFVTWLDLKQSSRSDLNLLEKYSSTELLVLDDLGTRSPSEAFLDFLYLLINRRINKPNSGTVVSTNLNSTVLSDKIGSPILSRIASGIIVKFTGKDRRIQQF